MIVSGDGTPVLRKQLLQSLCRSPHSSFSLAPMMRLWIESHPEELNQWADVCSSAIQPTSSTGFRYDGLLENLHERFPDNVLFGLCWAKKMILQKKSDASTIDTFLSKTVQQQLRKDKIPSSSGLTESLSYPTRDVTKAFYSNGPTAVALGMRSCVAMIFPRRSSSHNGRNLKLHLSRSLARFFQEQAVETATLSGIVSDIRL